jgi:hypothetical protein
MRALQLRIIYALFAVVLAAAPPLLAQQDTFRWVDFHSAKDQDIVTWVTRSLDPEKWTAIREIGVEYDAALVVTALRNTPQSPANADSFAVWSVSLTTHAVTPLLSGVNLRWLEWLQFAEGKPQEQAILYDNCAECSADTYLTAFRYDVSQHGWTARWMRGGQAVPVLSANAPAGVDWTQVYAVLSEPNGRQQVGTWNHFDYGKQKPAEDSIYLYEVDPASGLERTQLLSGKPAAALEQRLCTAQASTPGLIHGQDSDLCLPFVKSRSERRPVTTPPANNRGRSAPPGTHRH